MEEFPGIDAFRAWLEERRDQFVGMVCTAGGCPLALWLDDTWDGFWFVEPEEYYRDGGKGAPLPTWAQQFVQEADRLYDPYNGVTGEQALDVLQELFPNA